ncbi:putative GNAT domain, sugar phosphate transporter domain-containing protein [Helianthus anomalus]
MLKLKLETISGVLNTSLRETRMEQDATLTTVALAHKIGHVAATVSISKLAVSFTHIIKSGELVFSVLVSRFILGDSMYTRLCFVCTCHVNESRNQLAYILFVFQPSRGQNPWNFGERFQDKDFPSLSGARIVSIATHPNAMKVGLNLSTLIFYYIDSNKGGE